MVSKSTSKKTAVKKSVAKKSVAKKAVKVATPRKQAKGLGRGLGALLGEDVAIAQVIRGDSLSESVLSPGHDKAQGTAAVEEKSNTTNTLRLNQLKAGKYQPRTHM